MLHSELSTPTWLSTADQPISQSWRGAPCPSEPPRAADTLSRSAARSPPSRNQDADHSGREKEKKASLRQSEAKHDGKGIYCGRKKRMVEEKGIGRFFGRCKVAVRYRAVRCAVSSRNADGFPLAQRGKAETETGDQSGCRAKSVPFRFRHLGKIFSFRLTWGFRAVPSNHLFGLFSVPAPLFGLLAGSSAGFFIDSFSQSLPFLCHWLNAVLTMTMTPMRTYLTSTATPKRVTPLERMPRISTPSSVPITLP